MGIESVMRYLLVLFLLFPFFVSGQSDLEKAEQLFSSHRYADAQVLFEKLSLRNPDNVTIIEYLGDIQGHGKNWTAALGYYKRLKVLRPNEANYYYKYGGVLGMIAKDSNRFKALTMIGDIREAFEKAILLNPKHIEARWALIELYLQLPGIVGGSESKARKYSDQLFVISPVDGYLSKGKIAEYFNNYTVAEQEYRKAIGVGNSRVGYQKLADLYKNKMMQPEKAKQIWAEFNEKNKS